MTAKDDEQDLIRARLAEYEGLGYIYVANWGDDSNDGLTWRTAVRTARRGLAIAQARDRERRENQ